MIVLKTATESDIDFICACEAEEESARYIRPWPREWHVAALADSDCASLIIYTAHNLERVGMILLFGFASPDRSIELRRIVCARRGAGIGRAAIKSVKKMAFEQMSAHRLWLDVKSKNTRARHLYQSEGFIEEGVMRECLLDGDGFESLILMSILQSEL